MTSAHNIKLCPICKFTKFYGKIIRHRGYLRQKHFHLPPVPRARHTSRLQYADYQPIIKRSIPDPCLKNRAWNRVFFHHIEYQSITHTACAYPSQVSVITENAKYMHYPKTHNPSNITFHHQNKQLCPFVLPVTLYPW